MYKIIACLSSLLRCYAFPNPFENLIRNMLKNTILSSSYIQVATIFNFAFGGFFIWLICYPLVGIIYRKGEVPVRGSLLFLAFSFINTYILKIIFDNFVGYGVLMFIIIITVILQYLIVYTVKNKFFCN